jgi:hypothetical protein
MSFIDAYQCLLLFYFRKNGRECACPFRDVQWLLALPCFKKTIGRETSCPFDSVSDQKQVEGEVSEWRSNTHEKI